MKPSWDDLPMVCFLGDLFDFPLCGLTASADARILATSALLLIALTIRVIGAVSLMFETDDK